MTRSPTPAPSQQTRAVIFLHLPKTGGTTLSAILERQYRPDQVLPIRGDVRSNRGDMVFDVLRSVPQERIASLRLVSGHIPYGMHELLPAPSLYITLLRDPVQRALSQYRHVLRDRTHYLHDLVVRNKMAVEDFVSSG